MFARVATCDSFGRLEQLTSTSNVMLRTVPPLVGLFREQSGCFQTEEKSSRKDARRVVG